MAVRLRRQFDTNEWQVMCAARHKAKPDDLYLDDGQSYALSQFFRRALLGPESAEAKAAARDIEEWSSDTAQGENDG